MWEMHTFRHFNLMIYTLLTSSILSIETKQHMACEHYDTEWSIRDVLAAFRKEVQIFEMSYQHSGEPSNGDSFPPFPSTQLHKRANTVVMVNRGRNLYVSSVREATRLVCVTV